MICEKSSCARSTLTYLLLTSITAYRSDTTFLFDCTIDQVVFNSGVEKQRTLSSAVTFGSGVRAAWVDAFPFEVFLVYGIYLLTRSSCPPPPHREIIVPYVRPDKYINMSEAQQVRHKYTSLELTQ